MNVHLPAVLAIVPHVERTQTSPLLVWILLGAFFLTGSVVCLVLSLRRGELLRRAVTELEASPADRLRVAMGDYVSDPRILAIAGNLVRLVDGRVIHRRTAQSVWRVYRADLALDVEAGHWLDIANALYVALGAPVPAPKTQAGAR